MPATDDLFNPPEGDKFLRSFCGLAHSDREIQEMRAWIEQCDAILPSVFSKLAECLAVASECLAPVTPHSDNWKEQGFENALRKRETRLTQLSEGLEKLAKATQFPKRPFFSRHSIPSGGVLAGLNPHDFDETRNDEGVYDAARAATIAKSLAAKKAAEETKKGAETPKSPVDDDLGTKMQQSLALLEYVKQLPSSEGKRVQGRINRDEDFREKAIATLTAAGYCMAAVATGRADKLAEGESLLLSAAGSDPDLHAIVHHYFDNAQDSIDDIVDDLGLTKANVKKALADIAKLRKRFDNSVEAKTEAPKADKKRVVRKSD